jgi:hypothetical protein
VSQAPNNFRTRIYQLSVYVLCDRFRQATDMVHKTSSYYTQLSSTIAVALRKKWEEEVTSAENRRLEDPSAMDIIGAQDVDLPTSQSAPQPDRRTTAVHAWLTLALSIEERQYVWDLQIQLHSSHLMIELMFGLGSNFFKMTPERSPDLKWRSCVSH